MSDAQHRAAAEHMRRFRERERAGRRVLQLELAEGDILTLARAGYLPSGIPPGHAELSVAVSRLIGDILPNRQDGAVRFRLTLPPAGIARLTTLGWLTPGEARDLGAVGAAFRAFAEEAAGTDVRPIPAAAQMMRAG